MFNSILGIITEKKSQHVYIENNGIEWDILVPDSALEKLPPVGQKGKLYTYLQHTDVLMVLYGFYSASDRMLFLDLLKVDGIGPKGALKIMSSVSSQKLIDVLDSGDLSMLEKIPGVGKKTAGKMLLQLKGKLSLSETEEKLVVKKDSRYSAVILGLADMGYDKKSVESKVYEIAGELEKDESFAKLSDSEKEDTVFRKALVNMAG